MTEQTMTPDEVLAVLKSRVASTEQLWGGAEGCDKTGAYAIAAVAALIARNAELEADNNALRETVGLFADDAQRLEFLIDKEVIPHKMGDTGLFMLIGADHYPYNGEEHDTPREAIDAARAEAGHG